MYRWSIFLLGLRFFLVSAGGERSRVRVLHLRLWRRAPIGEMDCGERRFPTTAAFKCQRDGSERENVSHAMMICAPLHASDSN